MGEAQKKVVVRLSGGSIRWGYLPVSVSVVKEQIQLLATDGKVIPLAFSEIEMVSYVKDFNLSDPLDPEQPGRRTFPSRPRHEGLWLRMAFREIAPMEGLTEFGLGLLDDLLHDGGIYFMPPDPRGNTLRVFVPRHGLRELQVLGWVSSPARAMARKTARHATLELQAGLFGED